MKKAEDLIKAAISFLEGNGELPTKIAVQMIMYFIKERGFGVPFDFEPFSYGPFSR